MRGLTPKKAFSARKRLRFETESDVLKSMISQS